MIGSVASGRNKQASDALALVDESTACFISRVNLFQSSMSYTAVENHNNNH
jgi:hypothetical protein